MMRHRPGVVVAGRYALVRPLASGGMGSVWIATHRELEIEVAIKFMAAGLMASSGARTRFEREARVAARLDSQHVVQVLDYGVADATPYMVMELLKGESLSARLKKEGRLPFPVAARIVVQVSKALRTAHSAGLVHRDLKPANVFLARKDEDEVVKVLDFGVVKAESIGASAGLTGSGMMIGSIHYMSPEQLRCSRSVDRRSDLWSLGVILYRALTGRLPFPGDFGDVLVGIQDGHVPPPSSIAPDLPPSVDAFFARALARDVDERFSSASELSEAFCSIALEARSPLPPLPPPSRPLAKTARETFRMLPPPLDRGAPAEQNNAADAVTLFMNRALDPPPSAVTMGDPQRVPQTPPVHDSTMAAAMQITRRPPDAAVERAPVRSRALAVAVVLLASAGLVYTALALRLVSAPAVSLSSPAAAAPPIAARAAPATAASTAPAVAASSTPPLDAGPTAPLPSGG